MSAAPNTILKWITYQLADIDDDRRIERIEIFHTVEGESGERLLVRKLKNAEDPDDISTLLYESAETDAASRPHGVSHRYTMVAFRAEDPEPVAQSSFLIHGKGMQHDKSFIDTEVGASNERGLMGQLMRQNAELHRLMVMDQGRLAAELEAERRRRQSMEDQATRTFELHQKLMDRSSQRELEHAKEVARQRNMSELVDVFKVVGPTMVTKILGQTGLINNAPQSQSALRGSTVGRLLANLSAQENAGIMQALEGNHPFLFMDLMMRFHQGQLDNVDLQMVDESVKNFLSSLSDREAENIFKAITNDDNRAAFENLYKSYGRSYQEDQDKKPIPLRRPT